jgi:hypothetical protein
MSVPAKLTLAQQELVHHNLVSVIKSQSIRPLQFLTAGKQLFKNLCHEFLSDMQKHQQDSVT